MAAAPDPLSSEALLRELDEVSKEIPNIVQYLGSALGTLKDLDPARKDVWARNLTGLGGQYYGRLDRIQLSLRKVVRALHERGSSPYAIRPPLPGHPLPAAFEPVVSPFPTPAEPTSGEPSTEQSKQGQATTDAEEQKDPGLSVYAQRLEVAILQELQQALQEMEGEAHQSGSNEDGDLEMTS